MELINNYKSWLKNTDGYTDIQKILIQAMALIVEAQTNAKRALDSANIIIMSDGESKIDYKELKKARNAIHRDTPLQTMFVALGSSNDKLKKFAQDTKLMGMDSQDLYRFFSNSEINNIIHKSQQNNLEKYKNSFYSLKQPRDITQDDRSKITSIAQTIKKEIKELKDKILIRITPNKKPYYHKKDLDARTRSVSKIMFQERKIEGWLHEFREWIEKHGIQKRSELLDLILDDLMINFEKLLNVKFEDLSHHELEQLKHLLKTNK